MTQRHALHGSTALLIALAGMAQADVTAQQVWDNISGFYGAAGYRFETGSVEAAGGTVTVADLKVSFPNPYADMQDELAVDIFALIPSLVLEEAGDGTVNVTSSDIYTIEVLVRPDGAQSGRFGLTLDQTGMVVAASGAPELVTYDVSAPDVTATLDVIELPGEAGAADAFDVNLSLTELSGTYTVGSGATPTLALSLDGASAAFDVKGADPRGGGRLDARIGLGPITLTTNTTFPAEGGTPGDLTSMLRAGMVSSSNMTHGGSTYAVDFQKGRDGLTVNGSAAGGAAVSQMSDQGMTYRVSNTDMALTASGPNIPLPEVALSAASTAFGMTLPALASDTAQDLGLTLRLEGLSVSDMIWGLVDPGAQLPRDPANIILELAGRGNWAIDILDPKAMTQMPAGLPGALEAMDLTELELSLAGASLTGSGAFTFNMDDTQTFPGVPAPTGALDLQVLGANGLMDTLVAMGLLPQDQAMGARMMLGLFTQPGEVEDSLVSTIEIDGESGSVSANGQRLR